MEAKFTPGPWEIFKAWKDWNDNPGPIVRAGTYEHIFEASLAGPYGDACIDWINEADKRLIAASPEMYGLLERAQSAIDFEGGADDLVGEIRTLLAKINGKEKA